MKKFLCFLLFLLFLPIVYASYDVQYDLIEDKVIVSGEFNFGSIKRIELEIPEDATGLTIYSDGVLVEDEIVNGKNIKYSYITKIPLEKQKYFLTNIQMPLTDILNVIVNLPESAVLKTSVSEGGSIFPSPTELNTDGKRLSIKWTKSLLKDENFSMFIIFDVAGDYIVLMIIGVLIIIGLLFFVYKKPKKEIKRIIKKVDEVEKHLKDEEKLIVETLKKKGKKCEQGTLLTITDFSKANLSRILSELEKRKVIKKIKKGKKNIISLVK